ncbi:MAG: energy-coupling factor transporter ATPase [Tuberibacillus sp.]
MNPILKLDNVAFSYKINEERSIDVLKNVSLSVMPGEYVAVIGHNGSGKSTLAKHLNGLLIPSSGDVWVNGRNTKEKEHKYKIRQDVGMVFQHPDNQIVATIVEEDVAFGLENLDVPQDEMKVRVKEALEAVGMYEFRHRPPHHLSGGQKQRVAIAGVLAMQPQCIVFDEATSMLDSFGRRDVLKIIRDLHNQGMTVITVTHHMSEAAEADRIIVIDGGQVLMDGSPKEVFMRKKELLDLQLDVPTVSMMAARVHQVFSDFSEGITKEDELLEEIKRFRAMSGKGEIHQ